MWGKGRRVNGREIISKDKKLQVQEIDCVNAEMSMAERMFEQMTYQDHWSRDCVWWGSGEREEYMKWE